MTDKLIIASALVLAAGYAWMTEQVTTLAFGDPLGPRAFPRILTAALIICVLLLLVEMASAKKKREAAPPAPLAENAEPNAALTTVSAPWVVAATVAFTGVYFFLFEPLGFVLSSSAYLLAMTMYFNPGKTVSNALVSLLFPLACYLIFNHVLGAELARGILPI
jgi:putative tricarboxylic transport membrane protein